MAEFFPALLGKLQLRVNYRNHRKIVVIDGRIGFVGGFNVGREYLGREKKFGYWRDTHLCIEGAAVTSLAVRFVLDWNYASKENLFLEDKLFEIPRLLPVWSCTLWAFTVPPFRTHWRSARLILHLLS